MVVVAKESRHISGDLKDQSSLQRVPRHDVSVVKFNQLVHVKVELVHVLS